MKKILVIYHKSCPDGFGGAWAAWKKFGNKAEYVAVDPDTLPEKFSKGREIYSIDISYPASVQKKLRAENKSLVVLDHHASRKNDTEAFPENTFDNNHSGAVLSWKYFHPKKKVPKFLEYIEDGDLWRFKFPEGGRVVSYALMRPYDFHVWTKIVNDVEDIKKRREYIKNGDLIQTYERQVIERVMERAGRVLFEGMEVYAVNSSYKILTSELGHQLTQKTGLLGIVWYEENGELKISLRADGNVDVSKIAQKYGGGGHKNAAAFVIKNGKKPWKIVKQ
ncbi:MAG: DHHA1 domain-containing protein [Patescibacteria group bacterium]